MKILTILLFLSSIAFAQFNEIEKTNISGNEYYLSIPPAYIETMNPNDFIRFFIFSETSQKISITSKDGINRSINVEENLLAEINLTPGEAQPFIFTYNQGPYESSISKGKALKVTADDPFQLTALVKYTATSDGTIVLPKSRLGVEYVLSPYSSRPLAQASLPNMVTVIATQDNTIIDFTLGGNIITEVPVDGGGMLTPGESYRWELEEGDVLTLSNNGGNQTLSGSHVKANNPIQVLSANYCADIPVGNPACDYNLAQDYPVSSWGKSFLVPMIENTKFPSIVRIFAKEPNTTIKKDGNTVAVLNGSPGGAEGEGWIEMRVHPYLEGNAGIASFSADKPISLSFYNTGIIENQDAGTSTGSIPDPFQLNLVPVEALGNSLYFSAPGVIDGEPFAINRVAIFVEADENGELPESAQIGMSNGGINFNYQSLKSYLNQIGKSSETIIGRLDGEEKIFLYYSFEIPKVSSYNITSENKVSVISYGMSNFDSYGFDNSVSNMPVFNPSRVELLANDYMNISPNPAENALRISLKDSFIGEIRIFDMNGNELSFNRLSGDLASIDVSSLASGVYFLELSNNESKITKRFIKK